MERIGTIGATRASVRTRDLSSPNDPDLPSAAPRDAGALCASFLNGGVWREGASAPEARPFIVPERAPMVPGAPSVLRVHAQVAVGESRSGQERVVEVPWSSVPESTLRALAPFVLQSHGATNLFLTLPDRPNGLLRPADRSLRSYGTLPLRIDSTRLLTFRAREVLRTVAEIHRLARRELEDLRERTQSYRARWLDDALFGPADLPTAALFTGHGSDELWRNLQGRYPAASRLAFTADIPGIVRRWWQVGDTQIVRATGASFRADLLEGTLRGLKARFQGRPGSLVVFEGVENLVRSLPFPAAHELLQGARDLAEEQGGSVWLSCDPSSWTSSGFQQISSGFQEVAHQLSPVWTLSGAGEESRLVPSRAYEADPALGAAPLPRPTLGEWLRSRDDGSRLEGGEFSTSTMFVRHG